MYHIVLATAVTADSTTQAVVSSSDKILRLIMVYGPKVLAAIIILIVGSFVAKLAAKAAHKSTIKAGKGESLARFFGSMINALIMTFTVIAVIGRLGIQTASFVAIFGAAGLAVGLALQGSLANLASGVLLIIFRPFNIGDTVQVAGQVGTVLDMQIFATIIQSPDNKKIIVPNGKISGDIITNFTALGSRRLEIPFMIAPEMDLNLVRAAIGKHLEADPRVLKNPAYDMVVADWGDKIKLLVRPYVTAMDYDALQSDLIERINLLLKSI